MLSLHKAATENPHGMAVVDDRVSLSFANLFDKSEALAAELGLIKIELGRAEKQPVAFVANNDIASIALLLALFERGIPAMPINPKLTQVERAQLVDLAGARWLGSVAEGSSCAAFTSQVATTESPPGTAHTANRAQVLIATSGSTGQPKLVSLSATALEAAARACNQHLRVTSQDRWLISLNLAHIGGLAIVVRCLLAGATAVLTEPGICAADFLRAIERHRVSIASVVPTQLARLMDASPTQVCDALRVLLVGGAPAPRSMVKQARTMGWPVLLTYGLSEAGSQVTTQPLGDLADPEPADDAGLPIPGVELKVDANGQICVRGSVLFDGYFGCPSSPFDAGGWFPTGDLGGLTETGRLIPLGRIDDRIVTGAEKVSPLEIETVILSHPNITATAVVGAPDATWGAIVAACIVLKDDSTENQTLLELDAMVRAKLANFKRPRRWRVLSRLPQLPGGKLDRRAAAKHFDQR